MARPDGSSRWLSSRVMLHYDADGRASQMTGVTVDMTSHRERERERAQLTERALAARREAEAASRAKDEFLTMLSHELRNPLGAISAAIDVLEIAEPGQPHRRRGSRDHRPADPQPGPHDERPAGRGPCHRRQDPAGPPAGEPGRDRQACRGNAGHHGGSQGARVAPGGRGCLGGRRFGPHRAGGQQPGDQCRQIHAGRPHDPRHRGPGRRRSGAPGAGRGDGDSGGAAAAHLRPVRAGPAHARPARGRTRHRPDTGAPARGASRRHRGRGKLGRRQPLHRSAARRATADPSREAIPCRPRGGARCWWSRTTTTC